VFVSRQDEVVRSLDSPALHGLKIGVQVLNEQYTPPGEALARRGLQGTIVGFDTIGDGADSIVRAVADQQVDIAIVWGPLAGYFAKEFGHNLRVTPVEPEVDPPGLPLTFAISMGVRKGNVALREELEQVLLNRRAEIRAILDDFAVPQLPLRSLANTQVLAK
jgi:mxaJ protein